MNPPRGGRELGLLVTLVELVTRGELAMPSEALALTQRCEPSVARALKDEKRCILFPCALEGIPAFIARAAARNLDVEAMVRAAKTLDEWSKHVDAP